MLSEALALVLSEKREAFGRYSVDEQIDYLLTLGNLICECVFPRKYVLGDFAEPLMSLANQYSILYKIFVSNNDAPPETPDAAA